MGCLSGNSRYRNVSSSLFRCQPAFVLHWARSHSLSTKAEPQECYEPPNAGQRRTRTVRAPATHKRIGQTTGSFPAPSSRSSSSATVMKCSPDSQPSAGENLTHDRFGFLQAREHERARPRQGCWRSGNSLNPPAWYGGGTGVVPAVAGARCQIAPFSIVSLRHDRASCGMLKPGPWR